MECFQMLSFIVRFSCFGQRIYYLPTYSLDLFSDAFMISVWLLFGITL